MWGCRDHPPGIAKAAPERGRREEPLMGEGLFQPTHLFVVLFIALLVFGPKRLPELGKGIGDGIRALKKGLHHQNRPVEGDDKTNG